uniref:Titin n=1 Tax=Heterorhabditis bacteriophora TaxID=37862 RepID=A0A1I7WW09_HETBA
MQLLADLFMQIPIVILLLRLRLSPVRCNVMLFRLIGCWRISVGISRQLCFPVTIQLRNCPVVASMVCVCCHACCVPCRCRECPKVCDFYDIPGRIHIPVPVYEKCHKCPKLRSRSTSDVSSISFSVPSDLTCVPLSTVPVSVNISLPWIDAEGNNPDCCRSERKTGFRPLRGSAVPASSVISDDQPVPRASSGKKRKMEKKSSGGGFFQRWFGGGVSPLDASRERTTSPFRETASPNRDENDYATIDRIRYGKREILLLNDLDGLNTTVRSASFHLSNLSEHIKVYDENFHQDLRIRRKNANFEVTVYILYKRVFGNYAHTSMNINIQDMYQTKLHREVSIQTTESRKEFSSQEIEITDEFEQQVDSRHIITDEKITSPPISKVEKELYEKKRIEYEQLITISQIQPTRIEISSQQTKESKEIIKQQKVALISKIKENLLEKETQDFQVQMMHPEHIEREKKLSDQSIKPSEETAVKASVGSLEPRPADDEEAEMVWHENLPIRQVVELRAATEETTELLDALSRLGDHADARLVKHLVHAERVSISKASAESIWTVINTIESRPGETSESSAKIAEKVKEAIEVLSKETREESTCGIWDSSIKTDSAKALLQLKGMSTTSLERNVCAPIENLISMSKTLENISEEGVSTIARDKISELESIKLGTASEDTEIKLVYSQRPEHESRVMSDIVRSSAKAEAVEFGSERAETSGSLGYLVPKQMEEKEAEKTMKDICFLRQNLQLRASTEEKIELLDALRRYEDHVDVKAVRKQVHLERISMSKATVQSIWTVINAIMSKPEQTSATSTELAAKLEQAVVFLSKQSMEDSIYGIWQSKTVADSAEALIRTKPVVRSTLGKNVCAPDERTVGLFTELGFAPQEAVSVVAGNVVVESAEKTYSTAEESKDLEMVSVAPSKSKSVTVPDSAKTLETVYAPTTG